MTTVITFENTADFTSGQAFQDSWLRLASTYTEDGFVFTPVDPDSKLVDWSDFTNSSSGASISNGYTVLSRSDGQTFGIASLDLHGFYTTSYEWPATAVISFTGTKSNGESIALNFETDDLRGYQTLHLPSIFSSDLVSFTWFVHKLGYLPNGKLSGDIVEVDNIVIAGRPNSGPLAAADTASGTENQSLAVDVLANDTDPDPGAVLTLVAAAAPTGKGSAFVRDNKVAFDPGQAFDHLAEGAKETITLTYTIKDEKGAEASSTVTLTVTGTNDAPVANGDQGSTGENTALTIDVLANDRDVDDGAVLTLVSAAAPSGKGAVAIADGKLQFTPGVDFDRLARGAAETVTLTYVIRDEHGAQSTAQAVVTVTGANDAPVAAADAAEGAENETLTIDVLANDTDVDDGAVLTLVSATAPEGKGDVAVVNGKLVFSPGAAFDRLPAGSSETVVLSYTMQDEHGALSSSTVAVTLTGVNDAPIARADVQAAVEDAAVTGDVLLNDSDVDTGDRLSVSAVSFGGTAGAVGGALTGTYGTLTLAADGTYTYTADADLLDTLTDATGLTDVFTYEVSDGRGGVHTATLEIQVSLADDARTITGTKRSDVLLGDQDGLIGAEDTIYGLSGADTIDGGAGADQLFGGEGHDVLRGGQGRDALYGEIGSDTLDGGAGDDRLAGGGGGDVLTGGSGRDVFVFEANSGSDLITDFEVGVDRIELIGVRAQGLAHIDLDGNGVLDGMLQLEDGFVVLLNVGAVGMEALTG